MDGGWHAGRVGGDRGSKLGGEVAELVGGGVVVSVVEVAVGECERGAAGHGGTAELCGWLQGS